MDGGGGLIRDSHGQFCFGFAAKFGQCNAFRAELRVVGMGMEFAKTARYKKLVIQMNNAACVSTLMDETPYGGDCIHLVNHCRTLLHPSDWDAIILHVYREGNRAADWLANRGVDQQERVVTWNTPPPDLYRIVAEDSWGVVFPRNTFS